ncbi:MAG: phage tail tape measure protein [Gammaproteobacteria bacterium]|nr:phage tail tape measure protein [Gammaproteobacteria bacterium]
MSLTVATVGVLIELNDRLSGPLQGTAGKVAQNLNRVGLGLSAAAVGMRPLQQASTGLLTNLAREAGSLDQAAATIRSMPDVTEEATARMTSAARAWAREHANSAEEFLGATYQMLSAGLNEQAAIAATQTGLRVATATMGDSVETSNLLAVAYNNLGNKTRPVGEEMTRLGDILTRTQQTFQIKDMTQLGEGLKYVMDNAITAKLPITQLATVVGQLNSGGLQGSMAGTAMEASMVQMTRAAEEFGFTIQRGADGQMDYIGTLRALADTLGDVSNLSDEDSDRLNKAFGQQGAAAVGLLLPKLDEMDANLRAVTDSAGAAADAAGKIDAGAGNQWAIMQNNLRDIALETGPTLIGVFKDMAPALRDLAQGAVAFAKENPGLIKAGIALVGIGAVASPILSMAGGLATLAGASLRAGRFLYKARGSILEFGGSLLKSPVTWYVAGIAGLAAAAYLIYKNWEPITDFFANIWGSIKATFAGGVVSVLQPLQTLIDALPEWARPEGLSAGLGDKLAEYQRLADWAPTKQAEFRMVTMAEVSKDLGLDGLMSGNTPAAAGATAAAGPSPAIAAAMPQRGAPIITQHNQITIHATGTPDQVQTAVTNGLAALADRTGTYDGG